LPDNPIKADRQVIAGPTLLGVDRNDECRASPDEFLDKAFHERASFLHFLGGRDRWLH
jgi:hypothetical protein